MQSLRALLVQAETVWERPEENLSRARELIRDARADMVVLPETFSTGFSMNSSALAEGMDGPTVSWMKSAAKETGAVITGSVILKENDRVFNRLIWATPEGAVRHYDKRHLFSLLGEDKNFSRGRERKIFELEGWRICPQICYDLRFPVWCRNRADYDLLLFAANWPSTRHAAWRALLQARAIENQAFVVGVNRAGQDPNGLQFSGCSMVIDPLGRIVMEMGAAEEVRLVDLDVSVLQETRENFPFLRDRDAFSVTME